MIEKEMAASMLSIEFAFQSSGINPNAWSLDPQQIWSLAAVAVTVAAAA